jgi:hypothetical protein
MMLRLSPFGRVSLALTLASAFTCACSAPATTSPQPIAADQQGALSTAVPSLGYMLTAEPGTFQSGEQLRIGPADPLSSAGDGKLLSPPLSVEAAQEPQKPVMIENILASSGDSSRTLVILWDKTGALDILPAVPSANGHLSALVPHFTNVEFLQFPTPAALASAIANGLMQGIIKNVTSFFGVPYECPTPTFSSNLVDSLGYPVSVSSQVDVNDKPGSHDTLEVDFCNRSNFALSYTASGAGALDGLLFPRSTLPLDATLHGAKGSSFDVTTGLDARAVTLSLALVALEALPEGTVMLAKVLKDTALDGDIQQLVYDAAQACRSTLDAAIATQDAAGWDGAVACLKDLGGFQQAVIDIWEKHVAEEALKGAEGKDIVPYLKLILTGQAVNRLGAEWVKLGLPTNASFPYRLRCDVGTQDCGTSTPPAQPEQSAPAPAPAPTPTQASEPDTSTSTPIVETPEQVTATATTSPAATGAIPETFLGEWSGGITQNTPPIPPFGLTVTIRQGDVGSVVGRGDYSGTDPCSVHWTLLSASSTQVVVNENVDAGNCFDNVKVTLTDLGNSSLGYDFENGNGRGTLHH